MSSYYSCYSDLIGLQVCIDCRPQPPSLLQQHLVMNINIPFSTWRLAKMRRKSQVCKAEYLKGAYMQYKRAQLHL